MEYVCVQHTQYAFADHNMVLRYKFDMPNLYDFQYTYIPNLVDSMYGCTDEIACNYDDSVVYDDGSCRYGLDCNLCSEAFTQLDCGYRQLYGWVIIVWRTWIIV